MPWNVRHFGSPVASTASVRAAGAAGLAAAILLAAGGCDLLRDSTAVDDLERAIAVHAIVWAGSDTVRVLITRIVESPAPGEFPVGRVTGAEVYVTGPEGSVRLGEAVGPFGPCLIGGLPSDGEEEPPRTGAGCYTGRLRAAVVPGTRYTLLTVLPSGDTIRGAAVAPEPPEIIAPAAGARVAFRNDEPANFEVRWRSGQGTALLYTSLTDATPFVDDRAPLDGGCITEWASGEPRAGEDHIDVHLFRVECYVQDPGDADSGPRPIAWDSARVHLRVAAFDTAYARFITEIHGESVMRGEAGAGLSGAVGVFAGAAAAERVFTVVNAAQ
ncbi:MAG TPA: hypothetical protein VF188_02060 [Longimicrobiales bacterium]